MILCSMDPIGLVKQVLQLYIADIDAVDFVSRHTHGLRLKHIVEINLIRVS